MLLEINMLPLYKFEITKLFTHVSISFVELITTWSDLRIAIYYLNTTHISLEDDSATIVSWINAVNNFYKPSNPFLQDIAIRKSTLSLFSISHKYQEANQITNYLATFTFFGSFKWHNNDEIDLSCKYLLNIDQWAVLFT